MADSSPATHGVGRRLLVGVAWGPVLLDVRRGSEGVWRTVRAERCRVRKRKEERENDFFVWGGSAGSLPVSYTHLTLPTKRIV